MIWYENTQMIWVYQLIWYGKTQMIWVYQFIWYENIQMICISAQMNCAVDLQAAKIKQGTFRKEGALLFH